MNLNVLLLFSVAFIALACTAELEPGAEVAEPSGVDEANSMAGEPLLTDKGDSQTIDAQVAVVSGGVSENFLIFDEEQFVQARASNKTIVLFFYASWCPPCREEETQARAAFSTLNGSDVIGFRVNFKDSETERAETELAREFGIAYQHTKIILKNGKQVVKAPDTWDTQRYISELAKV